MLLLKFSGSIITNVAELARESLSESFFQAKIWKWLSNRDFLPFVQKTTQITH